MSQRRILVEFAPGFTPFSESPTWIDFGFDMTDMSPRLRSAEWTIGRDNELEHFTEGRATVVLKNRDRYLDADYPAGPWFGQLVPYVPVRIRSQGPVPALDLPGGGSSTATTPDHASFVVTDLDVSMRLAMDDWTPAATTFLVGQTAIIGDVGWSIQVATTGHLQLTWSPDGTAGAAITRSTTNPLGFVNGSDHTLRVTLDVNDGAGNRVVKFYVDDVLLETFTTAGTTTIFNSTQPLTISIGASLAGMVRQFELRSGIDGTVVAGPDFMIQQPGTTSFTDAAGRTWTVNGTATIALDPDTIDDEFYGFVTQGWQQQLAPQGTGECRLELVDLLGVLGGYKLPDMFIWQLNQVPDLKAIWDLSGSPVNEIVADIST